LAYHATEKRWNWLFVRKPIYLAKEVSSGDENENLRSFELKPAQIPLNAKGRQYANPPHHLAT
jgi:hypothetical protein